jgi:hypothetical protein
MWLRGKEIVCHQVLGEDLFMNNNLLAKLLLLASTFKITLKENDVDCQTEESFKRMEVSTEVMELGP